MRIRTEDVWSRCQLLRGISYPEIAKAAKIPYPSFAKKIAGRDFTPDEMERLMAALDRLESLSFEERKAWSIK